MTVSKVLNEGTRSGHRHREGPRTRFRGGMWVNYRISGFQCQWPLRSRLLSNRVGCSARSPVKSCRRHSCPQQSPVPVITCADDDADYSTAVSSEWNTGCKPLSLSVLLPASSILLRVILTHISLIRVRPLTSRKKMIEQQRRGRGETAVFLFTTE